jgi:hypothetical protein
VSGPKPDKLPGQWEAKVMNIWYTRPNFLVRMFTAHAHFSKLLTAFDPAWESRLWNIRTSLRITIAWVFQTERQHQLATCRLALSSKQHFPEFWEDALARYRSERIDNSDLRELLDQATASALGSTGSCPQTPDPAKSPQST